MQATCLGHSPSDIRSSKIIDKSKVFALYIASLHTLISILGCGNN